MRTDELIKTLSADTGVDAPYERAVLWLFPAVLAMAGVVAATLGIRPDLLTAVQQPLSSLRFVFGLSLGFAALGAAMVLARPGARLGLRIVPILIIAISACLLWISMYFAVPAEGRVMAIMGKTVTVCLVTIPALAILPVSVMFMMLRRAAPTRPRLAGVMAGLAGGGLAAATYALHCTEDSPLFYVTWYGLGILIVSVASGLAASRLLRW